MKTVITMSTKSHNINNTAKFIYNFLTSQTELPDIFYLVLSSEVYPNQNMDLPEDLLKICKYFNVNIKWVGMNEYTHMKWYVYPEHISDLVISIAEDETYPTDLVAKAKSVASNKGVVYNIFENMTFLRVFTGIRSRLFANAIDNRPSVLKRLTSQLVIPPNTFPEEIMLEQNIIARQEFCPHFDNVWLTPFLIMHDIQISSLGFKCEKENDKLYDIHKMNEIQNCWWSNACSLEDIELYIALRLFPGVLKKWKEIFPSYLTNEWDSTPISQLKDAYYGEIARYDDRYNTVKTFK